MYNVIAALLTFVSSFMVSDTISHAFTHLEKQRLSVVFISLWVAVTLLTLVGRELLFYLGFMHIVLFCFSAAIVYYGKFGGHKKDYIEVPLKVYAPLFLLTYILRILDI